MMKINNMIVLLNKFEYIYWNINYIFPYIDGKSIKFIFCLLN
jgi:hypothetical protein